MPADGAANPLGNTTGHQLDRANFRQVCVEGLEGLLYHRSDPAGQEVIMEDFEIDVIRHQDSMIARL